MRRTFRIPTATALLALLLAPATVLAQRDPERDEPRAEAPRVEGVDDARDLGGSRGGDGHPGAGEEPDGPRCRAR